MNSKIVSAAAASLLALLISACSANPTKSAEAPKEPAAPVISEEAQKALAQAETDIKTAKAKFALWTTAETAFKIAQEAAKAGDSAGVISQATYVSGQVKQGLAQVNYPTTEQK